MFNTRTSSDVKITMIYHLCFVDGVCMWGVGGEYPQWAYEDLEESLGTFKALDYNVHFFRCHQ